jgi:hypothetical protein
MTSALLFDWCGFRWMFCKTTAVLLACQFRLVQKALIIAVRHLSNISKVYQKTIEDI